MKSTGWSSFALIDASAAVMLVLEEPGCQQARARLLEYFNPAGSFFITSFCFFEALGVLKRKLLKEQIVRDHYFKCCFMLFAYVKSSRLRIENVDFTSHEKFMEAKRLGEKYGLDLSDALQLVSLKQDWLSHLVQESKTMLVTADGPLEAAAKSEDLRVINCRREKICD